MLTLSHFQEVISAETARTQTMHARVCFASSGRVNLTTTTERSTTRSSGSTRMMMSACVQRVRQRLAMPEKLAKAPRLLWTGSSGHFATISLSCQSAHSASTTPAACTTSKIVLIKRTSTSSFAISTWRTDTSLLSSNQLASSRRES
jgi:hypothetical protein